MQRQVLGRMQQWQQGEAQWCWLVLSLLFLVRVGKFVVCVAANAVVIIHLLVSPAGRVSTYKRVPPSYDRQA